MARLALAAALLAGAKFLPTITATPLGTRVDTSPNYFLVFGDSYSQTGFDVNSTKPSAGNPFGNPQLPGWTTSGGLNWVGYLTSQFNTSLTLTYNFAYGGATTNASLVKPFAPTVLSYVDQIAQFQDSGMAAHPSYAPWKAADTLVGVWMGVNDVGNSWFQPNASDIFDAIMDSYFGGLVRVFEAGARNFTLLNAPPISLAPTIYRSQNNESRAQLDTATKLYNSKLATRAAEFSKKHEGTVMKVVDTWPAFVEAVNNPTKYGAPDALCYGDGITCLWFNDYHPGVAIQKLVGEAVAAAWKGSFF